MSSRIVGVISKEESNAIIRLTIVVLWWAAVFCFSAVLVTIVLNFAFPNYIEGILGQLSDKEIQEIKNETSLFGYAMTLWYYLPFWIIISVLVFSLIVVFVLPKKILILITVILSGIVLLIGFLDSNGNITSYSFLWF